METKLYYTDCIRCEEVAITYQYYNLYENMSMNPIGMKMKKIYW